MELYSDTSYDLSRILTLRYSTSFGQSSKLFAPSIRKHIYAVYGLVRIADEIVDTYQGGDSAAQLTKLEADTYKAIETRYSTNPIIHAFALTADHYSIGRDLIATFFESMRMDLSPQTYTKAKYEAYIHGSAEVIGLMCLKVFCGTNKKQFKILEPGAKALGAAYQKVNFLRDIASDYQDRERVYFPGVAFESFNTQEKDEIIADIKKDFKKAASAINKLPLSARKAVRLSFDYYSKLLEKLKNTPVEKIKSTRVRVSTVEKSAIFIRHSLTKRPR